MLTKIRSLILVVLGVSCGVYVVTSNLHKFQTARNPAAIRHAYDITHLRGSNLDAALKERLLSGVETFKDEQGVGIGFGHFAFSLDSGEKILGCRAYDKINLSFEAEGVAVNGEKPKMTVEGHCEYSSDLTKINPLWIPARRIFGERPADGDFSDYDRPVQVKFSNVADEWPRKWVLIGVSVIGEKGQVDISQYEVGQILGRPFLIDLEN